MVVSGALILKSILGLSDTRFGLARRRTTSMLLNRDSKLFPYSMRSHETCTNVSVGLHMEHPVGGFQKPHGFYAEEETWYMPGTGDVPVTFTSKKDIALSVIELIKMALKDPDSVPDNVRISGSHNTPKEI